MTEENKQKLIDDTLKSIEKQFGKGSIMKLGDKVYEHMEVVPTGTGISVPVGDVINLLISKSLMGKSINDSIF